MITLVLNVLNYCDSQGGGALLHLDPAGGALLPHTPGQVGGITPHGAPFYLFSYLTQTT